MCVVYWKLSECIMHMIHLKMYLKSISLISPASTGDF